MMNRRQLREQIFKLLFRVEFNSIEEMPEQKRLFLEETEVFEEKEQKLIDEKYSAIMEKLAAIDELINEKVEGWTTRRMGKVELTILRLAIFEILHDDQVPTSVAINEAVELAKKYGQNESSAFVNGVLAKFA